MEKYIVHIDMDAFFASVEQRDDPALRGKPVVVGADPKEGKGRGVVSTCSYEARKFGIHSAMPISRAWRLCPRAIFVPVDMERYGAASDKVFTILGSFSPRVEPVSIDEAYLDISDTFHLFGAPRDACARMKERIRQETGLTASVGLAPTKMAAKIASDLKKPDGLVEVTRAELRQFLRPLGIGAIWGLGPKSEEKLRSLGIHTVGELADSAPVQLKNIFGSAGEYFWQAANGIDEREVEARGEAKSMSAESTFERDVADTRQVDAEIVSLCEQVSRRMRAEKCGCRTITLKVRYADFSTYTRSVTSREPTNFAEELITCARNLFGAFPSRGRRIRLVGVRASHLAPSDGPITLFPDDPSVRKEKLHSAVDAIKDRFGERAITRASSKKQ